MQACNIASCDSELRDKGIVGLENRGKQAERLWADFQSDPEQIADEAEAMRERFDSSNSPFRSSSQGDAAAFTKPPSGPTEVLREIRTRRVQRFFRNALHASYEGRCALTGLTVPEVLTASHIIPWSEDRARRADPRNGVLLNSLHDRAFDRGLMTFDENLRVVLSVELKHTALGDYATATFAAYEGQALAQPKQFEPAADALEYHRNHRFRG